MSFCPKERKPPVHVISSRDFCEKGRNGIRLCHPGVYRLCSPISFDPDQESTVAIRIECSDIVLDFDRYSLELKPSNPFRLTQGVLISRDVKRITLTGLEGHARVTGGFQVGIRVLGRTTDLLLENLIVDRDSPVPIGQVPDGVDENSGLLYPTLLRFTGLVGGIIVGEGDFYSNWMAGTNQENLVRNLTVRRCVLRNHCFGFHGTRTVGIRFQENLVEGNSYYGALFGYEWLIPNDPLSPTNQLFPVSSDVLVEGNRFQGQLGDNTGNPSISNLVRHFDFLSALSFHGVSNVTVRNNLISRIGGPRVYCHVLGGDGGENLLIEQNHFSDLISLPANPESDPGRNQIDALHLNGSIPNSISNLSPYQLNFPFQRNSGVTIRGNVVSGLKGESIVRGFVFRFLQGALIEKNSISNLQLNDPEKTGLVAGMHLEGPKQMKNTDVRLEGNQVSQCRKGVGFFIESSEKVSVHQCQSQGNQWGFIVARFGAAQTSVEGIVIRQCQSDSNDKNGFRIGDQSNRVHLDENSVAYNGETGILVGSLSTNVIVSRSTAVQNLGGNYSGLPAANIAGPFTLASLPTSSVGFLNVDIQ